MGWGSGSILMHEIICATESLRKGTMSDEELISFYEKLIHEFEMNDCDTLCECLGQSKHYDAAYKNVANYDEDFFEE